MERISAIRERREREARGRVERESRERVERELRERQRREKLRALREGKRAEREKELRENEGEKLKTLKRKRHPPQDAPPTPVSDQVQISDAHTLRKVSTPRRQTHPHRKTRKTRKRVRFHAPTPIPTPSPTPSPPPISQPHLFEREEEREEEKHEDWDSEEEEGFALTPTPHRQPAPSPSPSTSSSPVPSPSPAASPPVGDLVWEKMVDPRRICGECKKRGADCYRCIAEVPTSSPSSSSLPSASNSSSASSASTTRSAPKRRTSSGFTRTTTTPPPTSTTTQTQRMTRCLECKQHNRLCFTIEIPVPVYTLAHTRKGRPGPLSKTVPSAATGNSKAKGKNGKSRAGKGVEKRTNGRRGSDDSGAGAGEERAGEDGREGTAGSSTPTTQRDSNPTQSQAQAANSRRLALIQEGLEEGRREQERERERQRERERDLSRERRSLHDEDSRYMDIDPEDPWSVPTEHFNRTPVGGGSGSNRPRTPLLPTPTYPPYSASRRLGSGSGSNTPATPPCRRFRPAPPPVIPPTPPPAVSSPLPQPPPPSPPPSDSGFFGEEVGKCQDGKEWEEALRDARAVTHAAISMERRLIDLSERLFGPNQGSGGGGDS